MEPRRRRARSGGDPAPQPVGDVLDRWLAAQGLTELRVLTSVRGTWAETVGPDVARHTSPRALRDGVLVVSVEHSGWATELRFQERRVVKLLDDQLGEGVVRRLEARVDGSALVE
jgi:predicted nucleic acid-binding Zn ribbon protein